MHWNFVSLYILSFSGVYGHLFVGNPPPFRADEDISLLIMPLNGDLSVTPPAGQQPFPCKGYHIDLDGPGGEPVAQWKAGQVVTFSLFDSTNTTGATMGAGAAHSGGSCQVAFSYDKGKTWVVVHNWEGNCPRVETPGENTNSYDHNQNYTFKVPEDFPTGHRVIFAWTWINASGNREYYMSCSSVDIAGTGSGTSKTPPGPPLFIANLDPIRNECSTKEPTSLIYPQKYVGDTPVDRAPVAMQLENFSGPNPDACGSDNATLLELLKGHPDEVATDTPTSTSLPTASLVTSPVTSTQSTSALSSPISDQGAKSGCSLWTGMQHIPASPSGDATPDPLWAVPSRQRDCYSLDI